MPKEESIRKCKQIKGMNEEIPDYQKSQVSKRKHVADRFSRRKWFVKASAMLVPPLLLGGYSKFESSWLEVTKTQMTLPPFSKQKPLRILHLSDLHLSKSISIEQIEHAFKEGFKSHPHACMLTGDFITDKPSSEQFTSLENCLSKFASKVPTFACLGNHDGGKWAAEKGGFKNTDKIKTALANAKIRLLENEKINLFLNGQPTSITGLGDLWTGNCLPERCLPKKPLKPANRKYASIVLCHNPDAKEILRDFDWDLMLSGHTHGGQFKIPFTDFAPLSPVKDLSMTEGLHEFQNRKIFITRGVGSLYGIRINCRPEASVLEFG